MLKLIIITVANTPTEWRWTVSQAGTSRLIASGIAESKEAAWAAADAEASKLPI